MSLGPRSVQQQRARERETVRAVNDALQGADTATLRKVAAVRGLVSDGLRTRVWPLLLGSPAAAASPEELERLGVQPHRDSSVVQCDVARSLWSISDEGLRARKRLQLQRLLNAVVGRHPGTVFYYQGLHDVASVLLLTLGEQAAFGVLEQLCLRQLRDCTASTLQPVSRLLELLFPLLALADPALHAFLARSGLLPFFALSWLLTWHVHETADAATAARLFDLFLSSSPLMPLYVGLVAVMEERDAILALPCESPELHQFLSQLNVLGRLSADELAARALALYRLHPPDRLGVQLPEGSAALEWERRGRAGAGRRLQKRPRLRRALALAVFGGGIILRVVLAS